MSCLMLDELPLSEQVAVASAWSAALVARTAALLARLEPPASAPVPPPLSGQAGAGGSNPFPVEVGAMLEQQITNHPPLPVCYPGHRPHLYQAVGNGATRYYAECSACGVRTPRFADVAAADRAWRTGDVQPIPVTA